MDKIAEIISKINQGTIQAKSSTSTTQDLTETNKSTFKCEICNDTEFITVQEPYYTQEIKDGTKETIYRWVSRPCKCREQRYYERILENSGISEAFRSKTVNGFKATNEQQKAARNIVVDYISNFETVRKERNNSIALLGQPGSGKTHLTIAIANALLKKGIGVLYMQYREVTTYLKQIIRDEEIYQKELSKYKNVPVLLIDDLFKGSLRNGRANESEMSIMFEIINYRYLKNVPVLVSSEYVIDKLLEFDDATGSRIAEMCKGRTVELVGKELNYRMEGLK